LHIHDCPPWSEDPTVVLPACLGLNGAGVILGSDEVYVGASCAKVACLMSAVGSASAADASVTAQSLGGNICLGAKERKEITNVN